MFFANVEGRSAQAHAVVDPRRPEEDSGIVSIRGRVRGIGFKATMERAELPHPVGSGYEFYNVRPDSRHPVWLYEERVAEFGASYNVLDFKVADVGGRPDWEYGARARYGLAYAQTEW